MRYASEEIQPFSMFADLVFLLHAAVVLFNVGSLVLIAIGAPLGWVWVRHRGFRSAHVALMAFVTGEALLGVTCPLTLLEDWLRGVATGQSFVQRWVSALIYWNAPPWVFVAMYVAFLLAVIAAWMAWPPIAKNRRTPRG